MLKQSFKIERGDSVLILTGGNVSIKLTLSGNMPRRGRRSLLLLIYRAMKPLFPILREGLIYHEDGPSLAWLIDWKRALSLRQAPQGAGQWLKLHRLQRGWSLKDLGQQVGMSRQSLSAIEHGRRVPRPKNLRRIEAVFSERPIVNEVESVSSTS